MARPRKYLEGREAEVGFVQGRCSSALFNYLRMLAVHPNFPYNNLANMYAVLFERFINDKPWEHGLKWHKPKSIKSVTGETGFVQVNIQLPIEQCERVKNSALAHDVSLATYIYTALYWWSRFVHPPKKN